MNFIGYRNIVGEDGWENTGRKRQGIGSTDGSSTRCGVLSHEDLSGEPHYDSIMDPANATCKFDDGELSKKSDPVAQYARHRSEHMLPAGRSPVSTGTVEFLRKAIAGAPAMCRSAGGPPSAHRRGIIKLHSPPTRG